MTTRRKFDSYKSTTETSNSKEDYSRPLFAGFKPGKAFFTKLGNRGMGIDTLWVRHLIQSFALDDMELAEIALNSSLADVTLQVSGGDYGSPYNIGDFGFYTNELFDNQANLLSTHERESSTGQYFLSVGEWKVVDQYFSNLAHHSRALFDKVTVGDTIGSLAVKKNAFLVVKMCIQKGLDPLLENAEHRDLFHQIKSQYLEMAKELKQIFVEETVFYREIKIIAEIEGMVAWQQRNCRSFQHLVGLLEYLLEIAFPQRLGLIDQDLSLRRRCELLHKPFPPEKAWNIAQLGKLRGHIEDAKELIVYSTEKVAQCEKNMAEFQEKLAKFQADTKARQDAILKPATPATTMVIATKPQAQKEKEKRKSTRKSRRQRISSESAGENPGDSVTELPKSRGSSDGGELGEDYSMEERDGEGVSGKSTQSTASLPSTHTSTNTNNAISTPTNRQTLIGLLVVNTADTKMYYK